MNNGSSGVLGCPARLTLGAGSIGAQYIRECTLASLGTCWWVLNEPKSM